MNISNRTVLTLIGSVVAMVGHSAQAIETFCCKCTYTDGSVYMEAVSDTDFQGANTQCFSKCELNNPDGVSMEGMRVRTTMSDCPDE